MRVPSIPKEVFEERQDKLLSKIGNNILVLPTNTELIRNNDVHFPFRPDSNFSYFTGFDEPDSVWVYTPHLEDKSHLFVRPKDVEKETWDGFRYGPDLAVQYFAIDKAHLVSDFEKEIISLLDGSDGVYYRLQVHKYFDQRFLNALESARRKLGRSGKSLKSILDPSEIIGEMRAIKSPIEIEWQKKACEITAQSHLEAMKFVRPGVTEREVEAVLEYIFKSKGSPRTGYGSIVATGNNAVTLHYVFNDCVCNDGDLLLIDAGAEWNLFSGDITRTFPVNGKFSGIQKEFYQSILDVQKRVIEHCKPGVAVSALQELTVELLSEVMLQFNLLKGTRENVINEKSFLKYYPHRVSHWLGMDVHDAGLYVTEKGPRHLESGHVLTVEPGIYVLEDDSSAPAELRGIGIRIEDDILITNSGNENLTSLVPKEIDELEAIIGTGKGLEY